ncbi:MULTISPECIES: 16S rRNA (cytosine(967)-C(5))-methyltransferase RsmB [unclassified Paenibacillus]|uniref:16S rRNA (cytosine(967)-C(5))-methyltransferase RsmB n=1 Tax=unclassified Paenibacillus TaxID=185978 RepID=UPI002F3EED34
MTGRRAGGRAPSRKSATSRDVALDTLVKVAEGGAYSNLQLNRALQESSLSRADAALATELVYGTLQRQLTLDYWLAQFVAKGLRKLEPWVHQLLRLSLYQLLFLDRIPAHAAVNEAVSIARRRGHAGIASMVNGVLRNADRNRDRLRIEHIKADTAVERIALQYSYPQWLVQRWLASYGEDAATAICRSGNEQPHASIRVNPLAATREQVLLQLQKDDLEAIPSPAARMGIVVKGGGHLAERQDFVEGKWSLQDESSMLVAEAASPQAGMKVLDCCAAPGGKSTHLAELMEGKGKVWANDLHAHKRALITAQSERLKLRNVEAITSDALLLGERFEEKSMDVVLLDAPCSGFGVIRRKPEIKWTKTEGDIAEIAALQKKLLPVAAQLVRSGGVLVYSTCTIEAAENEQQVQHFLAEHPHFKLDAAWPEDTLSRLREAGIIDSTFNGMLQLLPQHFGSDGFFIARMVRCD